MVRKRLEELAYYRPEEIEEAVALGEVGPLTNFIKRDEALASLPEWVKTEERLPNLGDWVMTCCFDDEAGGPYNAFIYAEEHRLHLYPYWTLLPSIPEAK